jgi:hypothetical protein
MKERLNNIISGLLIPDRVEEWREFSQVRKEPSQKIEIISFEHDNEKVGPCKTDNKEIFHPLFERNSIAD